jgi:hypothetical protein
MAGHASSHRVFRACILTVSWPTAPMRRAKDRLHEHEARTMSAQDPAGERRKMDMGLVGPPRQKQHGGQGENDVLCLERCGTPGCSGQCCRPLPHPEPHWCRACKRES